MKKFISMIIAVAIVFSCFPVAFAENTTITMYALDGRTIEVAETEAASYNRVGWYYTPVTVVYATGNRTLVIPQEQLQEYLTVGWYTEPVTTLYAADGRTIVVYQSEVAAYTNVGWYTEPLVTLYSMDGRTITVLKSEVAAYTKVGWYTSQSEINAIKEKEENEKALLSQFKTGMSVKKSYIIYTYYGSVQGVENGKVKVKWNAIYDINGRKITDFGSQLGLMAYSGFMLGETSLENPSDIIPIN